MERLRSILSGQARPDTAAPGQGGMTAAAFGAMSAADASDRLLALLQPPEDDGIARLLEAGRPVVVASRALRGRVGQTYAYPGGGRRLWEMGALFAGARRPAQARIDLMLALGAGYDAAALGALFDG